MGRGGGATSYAVVTGAFWLAYLPLAFGGRTPEPVMAVATFLAAAGSSMAVLLWAHGLPPGSRWLSFPVVRYLRRTGLPGHRAQIMAIGAGLVVLLLLALA